MTTAWARQHCGRRAFTLVEMLVVLAIISILSSMILPSLGRAREGGRRAACASNLRQIGLAFSLYVDDNEERYPPLSSSETFPVPPPLPAGCSDTRTLPIDWSYALNPYTISARIFRCPSTGDEERHPNASAGAFELWNHCNPPPPSNEIVIGGGGGGAGTPVSCPELNIDFPQPDYAYNTMLGHPRAWVHSASAVGHGFETPDIRVSQCRYGPPGATSGALVHERPESLVSVQLPSETILLADAEDQTGHRPTRTNFSNDLETDFATLPPNGAAGELTPTTFVSHRHLGGYNALFADGHVKFIRWGSSRPAQWTLEED